MKRTKTVLGTLLGAVIAAAIFIGVSHKSPTPLPQKDQVQLISAEWMLQSESHPILEIVRLEPLKRGLRAPAVPQSGPIRIEGHDGAVAPSALVEVTNSRTKQRYVTTATAAGSFALEGIALMGDVMEVFTASLEFQMPPQPVAQMAVPGSTRGQ